MLWADFGGCRRYGSDLRREDYSAEKFSIQNSTFAPDADGVIPVLDGEWFEDDIVARIVVTHDHRTLDVFDRTLDVEDA